MDHTHDCYFTYDLNNMELHEQSVFLRWLNKRQGKGGGDSLVIWEKSCPSLRPWSHDCTVQIKSGLLYDAEFMTCCRFAFKVGVSLSVYKYLRAC